MGNRSSRTRCAGRRGDRRPRRFQYQVQVVAAAVRPRRPERSRAAGRQHEVGRRRRPWRSVGPAIGSQAEPVDRPAGPGASDRSRRCRAGRQPGRSLVDGPVAVATAAPRPPCRRRRASRIPSLNQHRSIG
jgi:hypothetical protein